VLSWLPLGHHWSLRNCVTVVEFTYLGPFCHPPDPPGASCPPLGSSLAPLLLPFGILLDTIGALPAPFVTLLPPFGSPLRSSWISLPPFWDPREPPCPPFGTLLAPIAPLATLLAPFAHRWSRLCVGFLILRLSTLEQSRNHRSAPFSALQTHVCQKQNTFQPTIFDIIPGFVSTTNLHAPPIGGSATIFLCKVAYGGKY